MLAINDTHNHQSLEGATRERIINADYADLAAMAKAYARSIGNVNCSEFPDIGNEPIASLDWFDEQPIELETAEDVRQDVASYLHEAEEHGRQFSPAWHWISALNQRADAEDAWQAVDDGISHEFARLADEHARMIAEKWCVTLDEPVALIVAVTYERWDEEAVDAGETDDKGFIHDPSEPIVMSVSEFRELVPDLEASQEPITTVNPIALYFTHHNVHDSTPQGIYENRSYHPANYDTARFMQVLYEE